MTVADLEVVRGATFRPRGNLDGHNQIATLEDVVTFRLAARQAMKIGKLDQSSPSRPEDDDDGIQSGKRRLSRSDGWVATQASDHPKIA